MSEVTLAQMLHAREERAKTQQSLLCAYHCPIICFTMNIAGPVKTSPLIQRGFLTGLDALNKQLDHNSVLFRRVDHAVTGSTAYFAVKASASYLKNLCISIEESSPLGRLFDMDVIDTDGTKQERHSLRSCMVCGAPGRDCAAGRLHSVKELQDVTHTILQEHFAVADQRHLACLAVQSLIDEVCTTPKPGLVDRRNSGSHTDMDQATFISSANALHPYFGQAVAIGQDTCQRTPQETFALLKQAGIQAEKTMYQVTNGVNTHKGIIYSMGIICGALGRLWRAETPIPDLMLLLQEAAALVKSAVASDFASMTAATAGGKYYLSHGLTGIRGEAASGFLSVLQIGLPTYQKGLADGLSPNDAGVLTLLHLIATVKDTNLYHRGGSEGAAFASSSVQSLLHKSPHPTIEQLEALDDAFIAKNLSPGGCADLLAITYFLHSLAQGDF